MEQIFGILSRSCFFVNFSTTDRAPVLRFKPCLNTLRVKLMKACKCQDFFIVHIVRHTDCALSLIITIDVTTPITFSSLPIVARSGQLL